MDWAAEISSLGWFMATASLAAIAWVVGGWLGRPSAHAAPRSESLAPNSGSRCAVRGQLPGGGHFRHSVARGQLPGVSGVVGGRRANVFCRAGVTAGGGVAVLMMWVWLMRHQDVAVRLIPPQVLARIEGVGAVPIFMFILGVAWSRSQLSRQRHMVGCAVIVGVLYFLQGGWWMVQGTPAFGPAQTLGAGLVLQSRDDSCVSAACATALNLHGLSSSEQEMAWYTQTRSGTGATTMRAVAGLERRLDGQPFDVQLVSADFDRLAGLPMPALTALQYEPSRRHMVTLLEVRPTSVRYADPIEGPLTLDRAAFETVYRGQVILILPHKQTVIRHGSFAHMD